MTEENNRAKVSENFQSIYAFRKPMIKNQYGQTRAMEEIGVIKGLIVDKTKNYLLVPFRAKNKETTAWSIYALPKEGDVTPETWDKLHLEEEFVG